MAEEGLRQLVQETLNLGRARAAAATAPHARRPRRPDLPVGRGTLQHTTPQSRLLMPVLLHWNPPARAPTALAGSVHSLLRRWPLLLVAGLVMVALLLTLAAVVQQAVQQAQARHASTAARADANFRCNTMASSAQRSDCRSRASGPLRDAVATNP